MHTPCTLPLDPTPEHRVTLGNKYSHMPGWREVLQKESVLPKNTMGDPKSWNDGTVKWRNDGTVENSLKS